MWPDVTNVISSEQSAFSSICNMLNAAYDSVFNLGLQGVVIPGKRGKLELQLYGWAFSKKKNTSDL